MQNNIPLAEKMRPTLLSEVAGHEMLLKKNGLLQRIISDKIPTNILFWGPPGSGKTTLARILAKAFEADCIELSAVTSGKKDIDAVVQRAKENWNLQLRTVLFVDEIHRFNKAQQDAFLPHVENGLITLIGATTENPSFEIITPLLSRSRVVVLEKHSNEVLVKIIKSAVEKAGYSARVDDEAIDFLAEIAGGDARIALGNLELCLRTKNRLTKQSVQDTITQASPIYDKKGDSHYDTISAFIKSLRGSDEKAALYYLARMIASGEDAKFIARRMLIFASEDIGLAGNGALSLAVATFQAVERVGLPEAKYNLFHCAVALARSKKSREIVDSMQEAEQLARQFSHAPVPNWIKNAPTQLMKDLGYGKGYKWESNFQHNKSFLPTEVQDFVKKSHI